MVATYSVANLQLAGDGFFLRAVVPSANKNRHRNSHVYSNAKWNAEIGHT